MAFESHTASQTRRSYLKTLGGTTLLATGLAGCTGSSNDLNTIGAAIPQSGELDDFGAHFERQAGFALDIVNDSEERVEFTYEDTQTAENTGVTAAENLVSEDGLPMIFAGLSSSVAIAIAESVAIPNDTLMATGGTSSAITTLEDDNWVFRTSPPSTLQAQAMATMISNDGISSTAIIYLNDDFGTAVRDELQRSLEALGVTVTDTVGYESGNSSYSSQLNQAVSGDPEAIAFVTFPQGFIVMANEAFEMGLKDEVEYYGIENIKGSDVSDNVAAETIEGMQGTQPSPPTERDAFQRFIDENEEEFDRTPIIWEAYYFDAAMVMSLATVAADSYESEALRDNVYDLSRSPGDTYSYWEFDEAAEALSNGDPINYQGVSGDVDINDDGDVVGTYRRWQFTDGSFETGEFIDVSDEL